MKIKSQILKLVVILILSLSLFSVGSLAYAEDEDILVELKFRELQQIDKETQEYPLLKDLAEKLKTENASLKEALATEQKENGLNQREIDLQKQVIALKDQEIALKDRAFNDMKEVADRAMKLAEVSKPSILDTVVKVVIGVAIGVIIAAIAL